MILESLHVTVRTKMLGTLALDRCLVVTDDRGVACKSLAVLGLTSTTIDEPASRPQRRRGASGSWCGRPRRRGRPTTSGAGGLVRSKACSGSAGSSKRDRERCGHPVNRDLPCRQSLQVRGTSMGFRTVNPRIELEVRNEDIDHKRI